MDLPYAVTVAPHTSLGNDTGAWRTERPVYVDLLPPCAGACPAGEDVRGWLADAEAGGYERAWRRLVDTNPFPAVCGRVCYHPCETACLRGGVDTAVGINAVERFLGDEALRQGWTLPAAAADSGRCVLVVGAGPAGLAAAYHLRRRGHRVELRDTGERPGGTMRTGIPTFRLPRAVLDAEVERVLATAIDFRPTTTVVDVDDAARAGGFDAVFLAVGARLPHRTYVPAGQSARVLQALDLLGATAAGGRPALGRRVAVYGGGNTALDAARTARRLGAEEALVIYRRTREAMPADPGEFAAALAEGVQMRWLSTIAGFEDGNLRVERMELDAEGRPRPTGEFEQLDEDTVVLALGQDVDHRLVDLDGAISTRGGLVGVDEALMTGHPGVFAGGDAVGTTRSVTAAVGHGRRAADAIDAWLAGRPAPREQERPRATAERLNTWYYSDAPAAVRPALDAARRTDGFGEVVGGFTQDTALYEARRCLSCGNCFGCDNCYGVCPDNAVRRLPLLTGAGAYAVDLDHCKGCGICAEECPCGAIEMVPEPG